MVRSDSGLVRRSKMRIIDKRKNTNESHRLYIERNKPETESAYDTIPFL